jgi:hypothetical protein
VEAVQDFIHKNLFGIILLILLIASIIFAVSGAS